MLLNTMNHNNNEKIQNVMYDGNQLLSILRFVVPSSDKSKTVTDNQMTCIVSVHIMHNTFQYTCTCDNYIYCGICKHVEMIVSHVSQYVNNTQMQIDNIDTIISTFENMSLLNKSPQYQLIKSSNKSHEINNDTRNNNLVSYRSVNNSNITY
jgi:hypothetical protein